jgi:site-specific DNA recombinase
MKNSNRSYPNQDGIAIVRVSSRRQQDNTSHDLQEEAIRQYASENGIEVVRVIQVVESAKSAEDRPQYRHAISTAESLRCHHVLFYMADREARNLTDLETNERLAMAGLFAFHNCRDRTVLDRYSTEADLMMREFQGVQNKQYSRILSAKIRDTQQKLAEDGKYPGNRPPLGYVHQRQGAERGRDRKGTVIVPDPNPRKLKQVVREFELRAQGYSYEAIRLQVIAEGSLAQGAAHSYLKSAIECRIKNPFYRGKFNWKGVEYQGTHPLIIPPQVLAKIDSVERGRRPIKHLPQDLGVFAGGWLKCATCGCNIVHELKTKTLKTTGEQKTYSYYHCTNGKRAHPNLKGLTVDEGQIWRQLEPVIDQLDMSEEFAKDIAAAMNETHEKVKSARQREMEGYRQALKNLDGKEDRAYSNFDQQVIDKLAYERVRTGIVRSASTSRTCWRPHTVRSTRLTLKHRNLFSNSLRPQNHCGCPGHPTSARRSWIRYSRTRPWRGQLCDMN